MLSFFNLYLVNLLGYLYYNDDGGDLFVIVEICVGKVIVVEKYIVLLIMIILIICYVEVMDYIYINSIVM